MDEQITKYAVISKRTELKVHQCINGMIDEKEKIAVEPGTLVKVHKSGAGGSSKTFIIQVLDYLNHEPVWENLYDCPQLNLKKAHEDMWPFAIGIPDPSRRLQFLLSAEKRKYILYVKIHDFVSVSGIPFGEDSLKYDCIVRYIGLVEEIGPGYYFGLEILVCITMTNSEFD